MEQTEMVKRLCEKAGCSAEDARDALERSGWVLLDAMIILEREKKTARHTAQASTGSGNGNGNEKTDGEDGYQAVLPTVSTQKNARSDAFSAKLRELLAKSLTHALVVRHGEREYARLPILYFLILLCAAFYVMLTAILIALFCGCKLSFEGPEIPRDAEINRVMDEASDAADKIKREFKE